MAVGGLPEGFEAVIAEEHAPHARRHLHAAKHAVFHQRAKLSGGLLGLLERERTERRQAVRVVSHRPRQRLVLDPSPRKTIVGIGVVVEERHPRAEQHALDPRLLLRHYDAHVRVPISYTDNQRNTAEAWRWIGKHPGEAIVLSIDHIYDTFFGSSMWPTFNGGMWPYANLSQFLFIVLLFVPTVLACAGIVRRGWRAVVTSQTALVLAPVVALTIIVAIATGEVRYRIPFDVFFIVIACAYASRDLASVDGPGGDAPR